MATATSGLLALSTELIVEILSYLSYQELLICKQICRSVGTFISQTSALQYRIDLGLTGNRDGNSKTAVPVRLKALSQMQRSWENPSVTLADSMNVPSREWSHSKWQKDVFFGRYPDDDKRLDVFNFSSACDSQLRLQKLRFDTSFDVYSVDIDQDLVVLARCSLTNQVGYKSPPLIYLRSFKDQKEHPKARQTYFDLASYGFASVPYTLRARLQIAGEYIMLILYKSIPVEAIIVWHWPSGLVNALLQFSRESACLNAMCLESGHLLLAQRQSTMPGAGWFGVYVYAVHREEETPSLLAMFELPKLRWDFRGWMTASFFPRDHTSGVLTGGLAASPSHFHPTTVLVQLQWDRQYTLYTPLVTFLSPEVLASKRVFPLKFPWNAWGPKHTRIFHEGSTVSVICGYRAIFPDYILDFSPATLQTFSMRKDGSGSEDTNAALETAATTITSPIFVDPVVTSLPYRRTPLHLPPTDSDLIARSQMHMAFVDVDGPKLVRATCENYVLIPSSIEIFAVTGAKEDGAT